MKENEAAGNVLMDTTVAEGSLNQNPRPQIQENLFPLTKVWISVFLLSFHIPQWTWRLLPFWEEFITPFFF